MSDAPSSAPSSVRVPTAVSWAADQLFKRLLGGVWNALCGVVTSKKVLIAVATVGAGVYCEKHGCDKAQLLTTLTGISAIVGQGFADWGKNRS